MYKPFPNNLEPYLIKYLTNKYQVIIDKENNNIPMTNDEKIIAVFVKYAGRNDKVYYLKNCDKHVIVH